MVDILALGRFEPRFAGQRQPGIGLVYHENTTVARGILAAYFQTAVAAAVVHHDDLQLVVRLPAYRVERPPDLPLQIVDRNNNRNQRLAVHNLFHNNIPQTSTCEISDARSKNAPYSSAAKASQRAINRSA